MPAVSQKQQRFFAIAEHHPEKLRGKKPDLSQKQLHEFASTPTGGLPMKKRSNSTMRRFS